MHLEPAIQAHARLVTVHLPVFYACHLSEPAFCLVAASRVGPKPLRWDDAKRKLQARKGCRNIFVAA
ncbi:hypothetical protein N185_36980 [Sinorhizobium sp. GW3]|nr:hypothetical protein N185_36980 [Sinorhizobium sp. GW3]